MNQGGWPPIYALSGIAVRNVILVVEDDFWTRYTLSEYFQAMGYGVLAAQNADEAIALLESGKQVSAVFSDIKMPGSMDGVELAMWCARHHPNLPVLLTSANRPFDLPITIRKFFRKPYSLTDVEREIRAMI